MAKLILNDVERDFVLDLNSMADFEDMTGKSLFSEKDLSSMDARSLRALVYCCLKDGDSELTLEGAGKLASTKNLPKIHEVLGELFEDATSVGK